MMVEHDWIETQPASLRERLMTRGAAVDRDEKLGPSRGEALNGDQIRAVSFEDSVGDIDDWDLAARREIIGEQGARGGAVDIIVAENRYFIAALDRSRDGFRRSRHVFEGMGIRHEALQARIEVVFRGVRTDPPARENAREDVAMPPQLGVGERARLTTRIEPIAPRPAKRGAFDAEKETIRGRKLIHAKS